MLIAIIDDGIDKSMLLKRNFKYDLFVDHNNEIKVQNTGNNFFTTHGTTCARIIEMYSPKAEFISICIFQNTELKTNGVRLFAALNWCLENRIQLVHMSVGTEMLQDFIKIRPIIAKMLMQGQIVVAAGSNKGSYTIPACLCGVIGVIADEKLEGFSYCPCYSENGIHLSASSRHKLTDTLGDTYETDIANSYAAPTVTAAVHNILMDREPYSMTVLSLYQELTNNKSEFHLVRPDFIENAYILNLSKQILLNQSLFFLCVGEYTKLDKFIDEYKKGNCLVYLPSMDIEENKKACKFINNNHKNFKGILFGGRIESESLREMEQELIWNENDCGILKWNCFNKNLVMEECPTIFIYEDGIQGVDLTCNLQKLFQNEGYQCICVSNHKFSYLYGFEYLPRNAKIKEVIQYVNIVYQPDVIIFCISSQLSSEVKVKNVNEYIVSFSEEIKRSEENVNQSVMTYSYYKSDIEKLFRNIIVYFS